MINFNHVNNHNVYSKQLFNQAVGNLGLYILKGSNGTKPEYVWKNNKPTNKLKGQEITFYFPGMGVQKVRFPVDYKIPSNINDMELVHLVNPTAYQRNRYQIFFKADGIKKATK